MQAFTHLHVHTQYSILDGASSIPGLVEKAKNDGMTAIAITDHGNMFGVKEFYNTTLRNGIKPIIGCEVYVAKTSRFNQKDKDDRAGDHLILLAKNKTGYHNLVKLVSLAWTEGHYYKPRIDKELLARHHEGIIASSACLGGELPQAILNQGEEKAEQILLQFKEIFGDDYYLELQRHYTGDPDVDNDVFKRQEIVNNVLIRFSRKHRVKLIASNDVHFINAQDAEAHDRLICLNTGTELDDPTRLRYTKQEYFKNREEMAALFLDIPEALENTEEIIQKVEVFELNRTAILPVFPLPEGFRDEDEYLRHITYEGAATRYKEITQDIRQRIDFELSVIQKMGYPGYFLIVQDFLRAAREMGVAVGPGRGSAAGSVVAYCIRITDVDPLRYNLLFERFLNPDRISLPDIDIDFDEDGREQVLQWVVNKYGKDKVAQIITFGTMAAKMAIRDVGRVQKLPLSEADRLAKLVPERPGISLKQAYIEVPELRLARESSNDLVATTLKYAETLEGSVRHTGIHACGVIIGRESLIDHVPVCTSKDTDYLVTQYDGDHIESVGMLKMDFLGLKTLSIIKDTVENIKKSRGESIDVDALPLDDQDTFDLYSRGETTGLFQFESVGMKRHLKELKPNRFEDLIAMNALYRPGPMEYIPSYINRKNGLEKIHYDLPVMEKYLHDTYGITIYQEQVMQLSQAMAGFTAGEADSLRKAMGKKKKEVMDQMKEKFTRGCLDNGYKPDVVEKVWRDWEAFAHYAFNKSHSTCYALVSYQTAYLKAHYPAEFMAAVLSRNISDIKKITTLMDETRRMGIEVLGPDINESHIKFTVNREGHIRFGLGAIKGVGESAAQSIIEEREANGPFKDVFDLVERVRLSAVNKKNIEVLAAAGAFDSFSGTTRGQYFATDNKGVPFIENLVRYGNMFQNSNHASQPSLFGSTRGPAMTRPEIPVSDDWSKLERLNKEKDLVGIYLSAHPLDDYHLEVDHFCNATLSELQDLRSLSGKDLTVAGIVSETRNGTTKNGNPFGSITLQDYTDSYRFTMFANDYINFSKFFAEGYLLMISGKVQPRIYNPEELEFKVKSITLLSQVRTDMIQSITLKIPVELVTDDLIRQLNKAIGEVKGNVKLSFLVYDSLEKHSVEMFSRSRKIEITNELIHFLEKNHEIEYLVK
jgi:DNA polymerase-3 subunit alpha